MKNNYLIFFDNNINNSLHLYCTKEELINDLISNEVLESEAEFESVNWIIFENGIRIKG